MNEMVILVMTMREIYAYTIYAVFSVISVLYFIFLAGLTDIVMEYTLMVLVVIMRFLAGFGIIGMFFVATTYIFKYVPKDYRRGKTSRFLVRIFIVIIIIGSVAMPVWSIASLLLNVARTNLLGFLIGIYSFILTMYIVPVWREKIPIDERSFSKVLDMLGALKRRIKKAYYRYFTRDLLRAYSVDFLYLKARLDDMRLRTAWKVLPVLMIVSISIPPTIPIMALSSWRIMKDRYTWIDKIFFIATTLIVATYVSITALEGEIAVLMWTVPYVVGAILSLIMFMDSLIVLLR